MVLIAVFNTIIFRYSDAILRYYFVFNKLCELIFDEGETTFRYGF